MLEIENVRVNYGAIEAVKGVSLHVKRGEVVTIIGANGAGKSTLMKAIVGLQPLSAGCIRIGGVDCSGVSSHRRVELGVALSPEGRAVFPDQTVRDNLILGAYTKRRDRQHVESLLEKEFQRFPRLKERRDQLAGTLSGGEQQMLAISRALMSEAELLLLDEPSLGLAPLVITEIFRTIRGLRDAGLTVLLVEQMANKALTVADRAYVIETGLIICEGTGAELLRDPKVRKAYLGEH